MRVWVTGFSVASRQPSGGSFFLIFPSLRITIRVIQFVIHLPHKEKQELNISAKFLSLLLNMAPREGLEPST